MVQFNIVNCYLWVAVRVSLCVVVVVAVAAANLKLNPTSWSNRSRARVRWCIDLDLPVTSQEIAIIVTLTGRAIATVNCGHECKLDLFFVHEGIGWIPIRMLCVSNEEVLSRYWSISAKTSSQWNWKASLAINRGIILHSSFRALCLWRVLCGSHYQKWFCLGVESVRNGRRK